MLAVSMLFSLSICYGYAKMELLINDLPATESMQPTITQLNSASLNFAPLNFCVVAKNGSHRESFNFYITQNRQSVSGNIFKLYSGSNTLDLTVKAGSYYDYANNQKGLGTLQVLKPGQLSHSYTGGLTCSDQNYGRSKLQFVVNTKQAGALKSGQYTAVINIQERLSAGNTVTKSLLLSLTIPEMVRINHLKDIEMDNFGDDGYGGSTDFCVYSSTNSFWIEARGMSKDSDHFILSNGSNTIAYNTYLRRKGSHGHIDPVSPNKKIDIHAPFRECNTDNNNSEVIVAVDKTGTSGKPAGTYFGTLYLTVEPK